MPQGVQVQVLSGALMKETREGSPFLCIAAVISAAVFLFLNAEAIGKRQKICVQYKFHASREDMQKLS